MAILICPECGEMCREYDLYCPKCGASCSVEKGCDGVCFDCEHDSPFGCTKPAGNMPFASPYPHSIVEKEGKYIMVEDSDKRSRLGTVLLALLPTGALGIHDFYSRRALLGILHLLLLVVGLAVPVINIGSVLLVSWGAAVAEAVLLLARIIKNDGKGYPFS